MKDYILGVDLGGTNIKAAAYRLESYEKVGEKRLPTQVEGGWEHVLDRVLAALEELPPANAPGAGALRGHGRARPAGHRGGRLPVFPNFPQWEDVPVAAWLGSACWARPAGWWRAMPWPSPGRVRNRHRPAGGRRRDAGGRRLRRPPHGGGRPDVSRKKSFPF